MRAGIHPLYMLAKVLCACGNTFETRSTKELIKVEICSACHPFFTGQQRLIDTAGRVERFKKRFETTQGKTIVRKLTKKVAPKLNVIPTVKKHILTTAPKKQADPKKTAPKSAKKD